MDFVLAEEIIFFDFLHMPNLPSEIIILNAQVIIQAIEKMIKREDIIVLGHILCKSYQILQVFVIEDSIFLTCTFEAASRK